MSVDLRDVDGLTRRGAARDRVGELHVPHAVLERRARNLLAAANRVDELLLDAPADPTLGRNRDLAQFLVAPASARQALGVRLDPQRAVASVDPGIRGWRWRRERAEAQGADGPAGGGGEE